MSWKSETMLRDIPPDARLEIERDGSPPIWTTPRELMHEGRLSGALFIDQIEWAFSTTPMNAKDI